LIRSAGTGSVLRLGIGSPLPLFHEAVQCVRVWPVA